MRIFLLLLLVPVVVEADIIDAGQNPNAGVQVPVSPVEELERNPWGDLLDAPKGFYAVNPTLALNASADAIANMQRAYGQVGSQLATAINATSVALNGANILVPNRGYTFNGCGATTMAFVMFYDGVPENKIHVCAYAVRRGYSSLVQVLVHEGAHVAGYGNECDATIVEYAVARRGGGGLAYRNTYENRCGVY